MASAAVQALKKRAAEKAVDFIQSGMVVGLGTGSTAIYAVQRLGRRLADGSLHDIVGIPTSEQTRQEALAAGVPLTTFAQHPIIDLTIDGADEIDPQLAVIKGGGGALLREKIVAQASRRFIIVADGAKMVPALGTGWAVPIEVVAFGWESHLAFFKDLGGHPVRREKGGEPFITDQGNLILDVNFGVIDQPAQLAVALSARAGIVEHGLFLNMADDVIIATIDGIIHLKRAALVAPPAGQ